MAIKVGGVYAEVRAKDDHLSRDLNSAHRKIDQMATKSQKSLSRINFKAVAAAATAAAIAIGYAMQRIGRSAIKAASDMEEVQGKFDVVFKGQQSTAEAWAATLVESYAMSRREAKEYLAAMQDLLVPMGMASDAAGKMSNEVVKLAADLGSFNNQTTARVMDDIQSALVGNYETMKKYGVVLNATTVQQRALKMGLAATKEELTAGQKAQAAYKMIVEGSAAAIGDMARTSGSYANQMKLFHANIENLQETIGRYLLPYATKFVAELNKWIQANERLIGQKFSDWVGNLIPQFEKLMPWLVAAADTMAYLAKMQQRIYGWQEKYIGPLVPWGPKKDMSASAGGSDGGFPGTWPGTMTQGSIPGGSPSMDATYRPQVNKPAFPYTRSAGQFGPIIKAAERAATAMDSVFTNAFYNMEDALASFVTSGKLDFKSLANSIIYDMARIAARQLITKPLMGAMGLGSLIPSFDTGGINTSPGMYYAGVPELHIPLSDLGKGGGGKVVNLSVNLPGATIYDQQTLEQTVTQISAAVAEQVAPGAVLASYENGEPIRDVIRSPH